MEIKLHCVIVVANAYSTPANVVEKTSTILIWTIAEKTNNDETEGICRGRERKSQFTHNPPRNDYLSLLITNFSHKIP